MCSEAVTRNSSTAKYTGKASTDLYSQYGGAVASITMYYYDVNGNLKTTGNENGEPSGTETSVTSPANVTFKYTDNFHTGFSVTNDFIIYYR